MSKYSEQHSPAPEILTALCGWLAAEECRIRSERVKAGLARAKKLGKRLGQAPAVVDIREAYRPVKVENLSYREAAKKLKTSKSVLHRIVSDDERVQAALAPVPRTSSK